MKKSKKFSPRNLCIIAGCGLIVGALVLLIFNVASRSAYTARCEEYVSAIGEILPPVKNSVPQPGQNNTLPAMEVDGIDFVALLEFPAFQTTLPVCNHWGAPEKYPCRFTGNIHESTLIIGVSEPLLPFATELYVGDTVTLTDMTGNRFTYRIQSIEISDNARKDTLQSTDAALTVFIKHSLSSRYTILRLETAA